MLDCAGAAALLKGWDRVLVISHASPDGDTLGSASALLRGLVSLGKQVKFFCADPVPEKFGYLFEGLTLGEFEPDHVMTVDVADKRLLGKTPEELVNRVELAIDHHGTHVPFAKERWVEGDSAATVELIYLLLKEMGVKLDQAMADCLYTGLTTDTGCFRYPERHSPHPSDCRCAAGTGRPGRGHQSVDVRKQVQSPGGSGTGRDGHHAVFQRRQVRLDPGALEHFCRDRREGKRFGGLGVPAPGDPGRGAGRHIEGKAPGKGESFPPGQSPWKRRGIVSKIRRRRPSGSGGLFPGNDLGAGPRDHGTGLRGIPKRIGIDVNICAGAA